MRTNFDFAPFRRSTVGLDQLFDLLERGPSTQANEGFPPFDITQDGDDAYRITLAVAGFARDEIEITAQQNQLIVAGRRPDADDARYIHRGIATRAFERRFALGDFVRVSGAELKDGLLTIALVREVPEAMKPHRIAIGGDGETRIVDQRADAPTGANENGAVRNAA